METDSRPLIDSVQPDSLPLLNGSWEQSDRSLNTAAVIGLLGIGVLYFNAQSILVVITIVVTRLFSSGPDLNGNSFDKLIEIMKYFSGPLRVAVMVSQYVFMLLPALLLVKWWHSSEILAYIRLKRCSPLEILLAVLATLAMIPAGNWIADGLTRHMHIPEKLLEINAEIFTSRTPVEFVWLVIVVCITPAICEEIFFRGFIQRTFERTLGWKSLILIGVLFGLFHFQPLGLIPLAMLGILFGYFFYRTKSLLPSMAAHFTNNFVAILFLYQTPEMQEAGTSGATAQIPLWLVGATIPVGIGLLFLYHSLTKKHNAR